MKIIHQNYGFSLANIISHPASTEMLVYYQTALIGTHLLDLECDLHSTGAWIGARGGNCFISFGLPITIIKHPEGRLYQEFNAHFSTRFLITGQIGGSINICNVALSIVSLFFFL